MTVPNVAYLVMRLQTNCRLEPEGNVRFPFPLNLKMPDGAVGILYAYATSEDALKAANGATVAVMEYVPAPITTPADVG